MPSRNVRLTDELDRYVEQHVQSGHYDNASEVIRAAIRELKQSEEEDKAKVEALRTAIAEGVKDPFLTAPHSCRRCESESACGLRPIGRKQRLLEHLSIEPQGRI